MAKRLSKTLDKIRLITQILFLVIFVFLFMNKLMQTWIFIFGAGVIVSVFFSRFYCGWVCPIGTLMRAESWIYKLLHIKRLKTPSFIKSPVYKWLVLIAFVSLMLIAKRMHLKINIILYVVFGGVLMSLLFEEELWHKHLCPYGTILNLTTRKAPIKITVDESKCISCGLCQKECPNNCIVTLENTKRSVESKDCIMCYKCQAVCPKDAIVYSKISPI